MARPNNPLELLKEARAALSSAGWDKPEKVATNLRESVETNTGFKIELPESLDIDVSDAVRQLMTKLPSIGGSIDSKKVEHAIGDVAIELAKVAPDQGEVRLAMDRALRYAGLGTGKELPVDIQPAIKLVQEWVDKKRT